MRVVRACPNLGYVLDPVPQISSGLEEVGPRLLVSSCVDSCLSFDSTRPTHNCVPPRGNWGERPSRRVHPAAPRPERTTPSFLSRARECGLLRRKCVMGRRQRENHALPRTAERYGLLLLSALGTLTHSHSLTHSDTRSLVSGCAWRLVSGSRT